MADVVMTDIPAPAKKAVGKAKAGGSEGGTDGKKRFEVKKVRAYRTPPPPKRQEVAAMLIN
jgi:E3 ubiquitin-protein ligase RBX1